MRRGTGEFGGAPYNRRLNDEPWDLFQRSQRFRLGNIYKRVRLFKGIGTNTMTQEKEKYFLFYSSKILDARSISSGQKTKRHFSSGDETDP